MPLDVAHRTRSHGRTPLVWIAQAHHRSAAIAGPPRGRCHTYAEARTDRGSRAPSRCRPMTSTKDEYGDMLRDRCRRRMRARRCVVRGRRHFGWLRRGVPIARSPPDWCVPLRGPMKLNVERQMRYRRRAPTTYVARAVLTVLRHRERVGTRRASGRERAHTDCPGARILLAMIDLLWGHAMVACRCCLNAQCGCRNRFASPTGLTYRCVGNTQR